MARLFHKFNFGYFGFIYNLGNSMSDANYYVLVWHLTWNSPNHYFGSFWHFSWGEISCQMPVYYIIVGIWHENSPLKVRACVLAASQFWIFQKGEFYCQIPANNLFSPQNTATCEVYVFCFLLKIPQRARFICRRFSCNIMNHCYYPIGIELEKLYLRGEKL